MVGGETWGRFKSEKVTNGDPWGDAIKRFKILYIIYIYIIYKGIYILYILL